MLKKMREKIEKTDMLIAVFLVLVVAIIYWELPQTYFKQDMWLGVGGVLAGGGSYILRNIPEIFRALLGEGRVLAQAATYLLLVKNPLNMAPIAIFALLVHSLNSIAVYFLAKKLLNKRLPSLVGAIFFAVNSVSHGALTFPGAIVVTLPAALLVLVGLLKFFDLLKLPFAKVSFLSIFIIFLLSLYFKEVGFFLFLFLPLSYLIYKKPPRELFVKKFWYFILFFIIIGALRIGAFRATDEPVALYLTGANQSFIPTLIVRTIFYPLTSFSLMYVPANYFVSFARWITSIYYPFIPTEQFVLISETAILDMLSILLSILILVTLGLLARRVSKAMRKHVVFLITFTLASFIPYIIVGKSYSYLDSRFYYLSVAGAGLIVAWLVNALLGVVGKDYKKVAVVLTIVFLFLYSHVVVLQEAIGKDVEISRERLAFLDKTKDFKQTLTESRNVFYIASDRDYYVPGNKVPFQSGIGYTLMAWYYGSGKVPKGMLEEGYLYELGSQGYKEIDGIGFGYFSDKKKLDRALIENKFSKDSVIPFYYDSFQKRLEKSSI